ncbi:uncharacterized protein [Panulirus ornatus]|uniref:uncharacterized protein isoform X3 n=1 Tax=Panulirus ornatus TaxID=150431 RepID=UPI003A87E98A
MDGVRSLLSDRLEAPKPHFPLRLDESASLLPDRVRSPLTLAMDGANTHLNSVAETFKSHFPHGSDGSKPLMLQGLEGPLQSLESTMALLAVRSVDGSKAMYPLGMENLRTFLPCGGEGANSYLQERLEKPHKAVRDRKDSSRSGGGAATPDGGEVKRGHDRNRDHKSHSKRSSSTSKSQLSNPRHDAHLVHAIRELHEEEFGLDAVLLAEGGHVGAHCAVLAAASPFLKSILLHATDHPAIISVTGTSLSTLQALVTCLYTGNIPAGASLYHLTEAARLLKMDELSAVLQKTFIAQDGSLMELARTQPTVRSTGYGSQGPAPHLEPRPEKSGKKIRSNRLDQILYQKLNVNHLAPDIPEPRLVPPPDSSRVPPLDLPRVPPPDPRGGILGELLTKADPLRTVFSTGGYSIADLGFDSSSAPLNLSKPNKSQSSSTAADMCSSYTSSYTSSVNSSTSTTSPCNLTASSLASSLASQPDLNLSGLTSLAPTMPGSMSGLLTPLTPSSMMSPSALTSLNSSNPLASLGAQHSTASTTPSKSKSSSTGGSSRSRSSKNNNSGRSSSSSWLSSSSSSRNSSQHSLPLLYTLRSGMMTPEVAREVFEQLKLNPHLASLPGFDSLHSLSSLNSSASLQSLANLHNLSSLQSFPTLFPFLTPTAVENSLVGSVGPLGSSSSSKDSHTPPGAPLSELNLTTNSVSTETANDMSQSTGTSEDQGALNLSSTAVTSKCESPKPIIVEESIASTLVPSNTADQTSDVIGAGIDGDEEMSTTVQPPTTSDISTRCPTPVSQNTPDSAQEAGHSESTNSIQNDSVTSDISHPGSNSIVSNNIDSSSLPLLLMSSGATLAGIAQTQTDLPSVTDTVDTHCASQQEPSIVTPEGGDSIDDNGIEVIEEIPGMNRNQTQAPKTLYHAGHMGRKRKGCGECEGCQVVEDCGQCRFCRDKAKFGGPNRLKQVCVYKRCVLAEIEPEESKKRRKVCEMRVCEQQQMEEVRAALSVAGEPSPYSTDSLIAESIGISSGTSSPTPDGQPSTHNDKMKLMRKMLKKKFAQPYSRVSPSKVRTKYYCGECPGCQTTTPCGNCLYCEDMPKFGGPGRYRQKCVKQLCVYHPRLQALKLSNRSKLTYDEQHISQETLSHLGASIPSASEETVDLGCADSRENLEELESLEGIEHVETDEVTEGEDSNATIHVENTSEEIGKEKEGQTFNPETVSSVGVITPETPNILPPAREIISLNTSICTAITTTNSAIPVTATTPTPTHTPTPVHAPTSAHNLIPATSLTPIHHPIHTPTPTPAHTLVSTHTPTPTHTPITAQTPTPSVTTTFTSAPALVSAPVPNMVEAEENADDINDIEGEEELDDELDEEEDEEVISDGSDVPSPPSTPSPRPRIRGRGRYRGRGRGRGKNGKVGSVSTKKGKRATRRGRRRRAHRYTLGPDDFSDYEDQYMLTELEGETPSEHLADEEEDPDDHQDSHERMTGESDENKDDKTFSVEDEVDQQYANAPKAEKLIHKSQTIEPDIFEFQDSQENVINNKGETTDSVTIKHNGPYVFPDEELSQGGRDVNENVGAVSETASA